MRRCSASVSACRASSTAERRRSTRRCSAGAACRSRSCCSNGLGLPVLVDNDVNTLAVWERLYGRGRERRRLPHRHHRPRHRARDRRRRRHLSRFPRRCRRVRPRHRRRRRPSVHVREAAAASRRSSAILRSSRRRGGGSSPRRQGIDASARSPKRATQVALGSMPSGCGARSRGRQPGQRPRARARSDQRRRHAGLGALAPASSASCARICSRRSQASPSRSTPGMTRSGPSAPPALVLRATFTPLRSTATKTNSIRAASVPARHLGGGRLTVEPSRTRQRRPQTAVAHPFVPSSVGGTEMHRSSTLLIHRPRRAAVRSWPDRRRRGSSAPQKTTTITFWDAYHAPRGAGGAAPREDRHPALREDPSRDQSSRT